MVDELRARLNIRLASVSAVIVCDKTVLCTKSPVSRNGSISTLHILRHDQQWVPLF